MQEKALQRKTLRELTFKDDFMFGAVMSEEDICKGVLEIILGLPIKQVTVSKEKSFIYNPEYKGVRLDVLAQDEKNTHYNVEMQVVKKAALEKRNRYYHSQIDMDLLVSGAEYSELPEVYVIFICDFDPFGLEKYCYSFENTCEEQNSLVLKDGSKSIFLSTAGKNLEEVRTELVRFLKFVKNGALESDTDDVFEKKLQNSIDKIKANRDMEERYMKFEDMLKEERAEAFRNGKKDGETYGLLAVLNSKGAVPEQLRQQIEVENDLATLDLYFDLALKVNSIDEFVQKMSEVPSGT